LSTVPLSGTDDTIIPVLKEDYENLLLLARQFGKSLRCFQTVVLVASDEIKVLIIVGRKPEKEPFGCRSYGREHCSEFLL
jgi:hypothetical protein